MVRWAFLGPVTAVVRLSAWQLTYVYGHGRGGCNNISFIHRLSLSCRWDRRWSDSGPMRGGEILNPLSVFSPMMRVGLGLS